RSQNEAHRADGLSIPSKELHIALNVCYCFPQMGESLNCHLCGKPATVHLTQIVDNKIHKVDLCEQCAQSKGVTDPEGFSLAELLTHAPIVQEQVVSDPIICPDCGFTPTDFKKKGRFGCPTCYESF